MQTLAARTHDRQAHRASTPWLEPPNEFDTLEAWRRRNHLDLPELDDTDLRVEAVRPMQGLAHADRLEQSWWLERHRAHSAGSPDAGGRGGEWKEGRR
jgi:hypothetical protein